MIPIALTAFSLFLAVALLLKTWHLQGQTPVYFQVRALKSARRTLLFSAIALFGAALAQSGRLVIEVIRPVPEPPPVCHQLVLDDMCEEELYECEDKLLSGEKAMLTYDNHCQCPWSPLTLETLHTP